MQDVVSHPEDILIVAADQLLKGVLMTVLGRPNQGELVGTGRNCLHAYILNGLGLRIHHLIGRVQRRFGWCQPGYRRWPEYQNGDRRTRYKLGGKPSGP